MFDVVLIDDKKVEGDQKSSSSSKKKTQSSTSCFSMLAPPVKISKAPLPPDRPPRKQLSGAVGKVEAKKTEVLKEDEKKDSRAGVGEFPAPAVETKADPAPEVQFNMESWIGLRNWRHVSRV